MLDVHGIPSLLKNSANVQGEASHSSGQQTQSQDQDFVSGCLN